MDKTTPKNTPWKCGTDNRISDSIGRTVADCRYVTEQGLAIVTAANAYDKLRRDNEALLEALKKALPLARRNCWLAYAWNDHNFAPAHKEARSECARLGITSFESANEYLEGADAAIKQAEEGRG